MTIHGRYENKAEEFKAALQTLVENPVTLDNFISYVSYHGDDWYSKYCSDLDGLISELKQFGRIE